MLKTDSLPPQQSGKSRTKPMGAKRLKKTPRPKINVALHPAEVTKMIAEIREEVEFHHGCAAELKIKLERLTGTAFNELLKVKELENIAENLKDTGEKEEASPEVSVGATGEEPPCPDHGEMEQWKKDLDRELEKLLIIKKLLEASLPPAGEKRESPSPAVAADGTKRILVVDDDATTIKIIAHFLEKEGYSVSSSLSGVDGLKKAYKESPHLILLDVMMPDLNGFQFLSIFRKDEENAQVPVVFLSSLSEEADVLKGLEIGAADYITKPFSPQVLMAKIKKNLNSKP
jgi:CheY-like chemotaxis protein